MGSECHPKGYEANLIERCRRARRNDRLAVLEGLHALKHALRFDAVVEDVLTADLNRLADLARKLAPDVVDDVLDLVRVVEPATFSALAPYPPETGVLTLARRPITDPCKALDLQQGAPIVVLEDPAHLGNVGAVIRVAAAAGVAAVITTGHHDPWSPAALRGSAGLHYAQPVLRLPEVPETGRPLFAIDPEGDLIDPAALPDHAVFAFGSERDGLSEPLLERADERIALPMEPRVSSLNLATAVAITLYAWRFNRHRPDARLGRF